MATKKEKTLEIENKQLELENEDIKRRSIKGVVRALGIGVVAGAALVLATKKTLDEIFVDDDWSDIDWDDDDDDDLDLMVD